MMYYKNHTHRKKVGHSSEFPFGIYWSTLKNPKSQKKILLEISYQFTHVYQKPQSGSLWDTEWHNFFLSFRASFFSLPPPTHSPRPNTPENQNFEKKEKSIWRCHHFKLVQQKTVKWCMHTQIWSVTDIIFLSF